MNYQIIFLAVLFLILNACSNNVLEDTNQEETTPQEETIPNVNNIEQEETQSDYTETYSNKDLSTKPPKIKKISVEALSGNLRDGFKAVVQADDTEDRDINFIYQWKHNGSDIIGATDQILNWQEEFSKGDIITLEVIPYDDLTEGIWKSEGNFTIPNSPPEINTNAAANISGEKFNYTVEATDPDGDELTYALSNAPDGMEINPQTGEINWEYGPDDKGEYKIGLQVSDSDGGQVYWELAITVD